LEAQQITPQELADPHGPASQSMDEESLAEQSPGHESRGATDDASRTPSPLRLNTIAISNSITMKYSCGQPIECRENLGARSPTCLGQDKYYEIKF
jgi:hypothetical protein